jgi:aryl-alcohol dehydrogenase-like predicted oxidoreductase
MKLKYLGNTGVLVSELCFGAMTFGGRSFWEVVGKQVQEEATELIKVSLDNGINFIDTANAYSEGLSEEMLGKSLKTLGINRQHVVIATKVRMRMGPGVNQVGLSRLHIMDSVNDSLRRLDMDHIDLLYIHGVDPITPIEETMRGLEDVVRMGKVRYIGVSNHEAWRVMKANSYAGKMGWEKFIATQSYYSIAGRGIEREIIPMAISENIAVMPWGALAGGFLSGKYNRNIEKAGNSRRDSFDFPPIDKEKAYNIIDEMQKIGDSHNVSVARIALAWMLKKPGITSIIIGAKNKNQLLDNIAAVEIKLTQEEMEQLDNVSMLNSEYPAWMVERMALDRFPEQAHT